MQILQISKSSKAKRFDFLVIYDTRPGENNDYFSCKATLECYIARVRTNGHFSLMFSQNML